MTIDRRRALALFGLGGASAAGQVIASEATAATPRGLYEGKAVFKHGVASGDPLQDRVVLWTRITAEATTAPIGVQWDVATDPAFKTIVRQGHATATSGRDREPATGARRRDRMQVIAIGGRRLADDAAEDAVELGERLESRSVGGLTHPRLRVEHFLLNRLNPQPCKVIGEG